MTNGRKIPQIPTENQWFYPVRRSAGTWQQRWRTSSWHPHLAGNELCRHYGGGRRASPRSAANHQETGQPQQRSRSTRFCLEYRTNRITNTLLFNWLGVGSSYGLSTLFSLSLLHFCYIPIKKNRNKLHFNLFFSTIKWIGTIFYLSFRFNIVNLNPKSIN